MDIRSLLADAKWDAPFFKRLSKNDTSDSESNQAGAAIPVALRKYLPAIDESNFSPIEPTAERIIIMEMYDGLEYQTTNHVRYQFQTWGGTRKPEGRITDGFQPLHSKSHEGDLLIFQRGEASINKYRLVLIRKGTPEHKDTNPLTGGKPCGLLDKGRSPVTGENFLLAISEINGKHKMHFILQATEVTRLESRQQKIARSTVFRTQVCREYNYTCAISGTAIASPDSHHEVEAAHVVPVNNRGTDDVRNGLALTRTLHWAFDQGLFGIDSKRTVYVPGRVLKVPGNSFLKQFVGRKIADAGHCELSVHNDALKWHLENYVSAWE